MNTEEFLNQESNISKIRAKQDSQSEFLTPINFLFVIVSYYSLKDKSKKE